MIRLTELPHTELDRLFLNVRLHCIYMHLAEQKDRWGCMMHTHDKFEFGYIYKGTGHYHIGGVDYRAEAGDMFVIPPGVGHYEKHDPASPFEIMFLMVDHLGELTDIFNDLMKQLQGKVRVSRQQRLKKTMNDIYDEIMRHDEGYISMLDSKLKELYLLVYRAKFVSEDKRASNISRRSAMERQVQMLEEIKKYLADHIGERCTLENVARHFFYHPKYLSRLFKKDTGISLSEFIASLRLEKSRELLAHTDFSIDSISQRLGYSSPQHFHYRFKQAFSMTPLQYREQYRFIPVVPFEDHPDGG